MLNTGCGEAVNQIRLNQTSSYTTREGFVDTDKQHNKNTRPTNQTQDIQTPHTRPQLATRTQETKKIQHPTVLATRTQDTRSHSEGYVEKIKACRSKPVTIKNMLCLIREYYQRNIT